MSQWRKIALTIIPELTKSITQIENRTELWDVLRESFIAACNSGNGALCQNIVQYYRWCVDSNRCPIPNDVQSSAVITFLEKMVRSPERIAMLLNWLTRDEVLEYSNNITYSAGQDVVGYIKRFH